jgi:uncharacterized iron-regulated membrane protein
LTIRKTIFWTHLAAGLISSIVVAMMSLTGVLLTYERQMKDWADRNAYDINSDATERLSIDELLATARQQRPDLKIRTLTIMSRDDAPPYVAAGRSDRNYIDPLSGEILGSGDTSIRQFFSTVARWHRWFDLSGDSRSTGRAITGAANFLFLFLVLSGLYLWLPPIWRWAVIRPRIRLNERAKTSKARDYNWHHVFGFWSLLPLFLIVLSALTISYTWARNSVYVIAGEEIPQRGGGGRDAPRQLADGTSPQSIQQHFEFAASTSGVWQRISITIPSDTASTVDIVVDDGSGGEPTAKRTLQLDRVSGELLSTQSFSDRTPAGKILGYFRWLHTGEALGIIGQTIAGIVSALSLLMVWTGLALAYRRLIQPLLAR